MELGIECPECKTKYKLDIVEVRSAEENRLIAAAPELLEACKEMLACINSYNITDQINTEEAKELSDVLADTYKAICKAEDTKI